MSELREAAEQYLQLRGELGFKMYKVIRLLRSFVEFAERKGAAHVTTDLALRWAQQPSDAQPTTWAWRLSVARRFTAWLSASDPHTQVPPPGLLPERYRRKRPYIYSDAEVEGPVDAASRLSSRAGLKGRTMATIFGLLAVTGLRISVPFARSCASPRGDWGRPLQGCLSRKWTPPSSASTSTTSSKSVGSPRGVATHAWRRSIRSSSTCRSRSRRVPSSAAASLQSPASATSGD